MKFNSIDEICKEFNIDNTLDTDHIIKELIKRQATIHPDVNPQYSECDKETFSRIEEAKSFLRENSRQTLVPISDLLEIIKTVKNEEITVQKETAGMEEIIKKTSSDIIKSIKRIHLPSRITVTSVWTIITLIWAFPSIAMEHPLIGQLSTFDNMLLSLSILWLLSLLIMLFVLLYTYHSERYIKNTLNTLENTDNQYSLFKDFIHYLDYANPNNKEFSKKDLEEYLYTAIRNNDYLYPSYKQKKLPNRIFFRIKEIIPKVSDMIILHALEKGVISKKIEVNWYDTYLINI